MLVAGKSVNYKKAIVHGQWAFCLYQVLVYHYTSLLSV